MISTTEDVPHSAAATLVGGSPDSESRVMLTLTSSSSSSLNEEDLFEPVSLCDIDCTVHDQVPTEASMPSCFDSVAEIDAVGAMSNGMLGEHHFYNHPFDSFSSLHSLTSFDSNSYASSSVESPPRPRKRQLTMPDIPPELAHLVDSVIMGSLNCMEDLKARISGVNSLEVSRFVVDALLATIVGVEGLGEMDGAGLEELTPTVMLTSRAALVAAELIPLLHWEDDEHFMSPRTRMAKGLLLILSSCTRNRVMCSAIGLLRSLLDSTEKILFDSAGCVRWNAWPLFYCLQVLGGHSLSVMDLERWVFLIKKSIVTEWALPLMLSLENAIGSDEAKGPAITFEFDGESSGLLTQGENRWPFSNGYAFATWIYLELVEELSVDTYSSTTASMTSGDFGKSSPLSAARVHAPSGITAQDPHQTPRRIFSFVSTDNQWVEAYFFGQFLVAEAVSGKGKKSFMRFSYEFKPQCWYFIGIEHSYKQSLLGKTESELRLYVDGNLQETGPFELIRTSKPLSFCTIGTNPPPALPGLQRSKRQCPLFAEMGPVYIFKESIGPDIMAQLASRGGDVLPSFGKGSGLPCIAKNEHARRLAEASSALDAVVEESLYFLYHPRLLGRHFCPDASPSAVAGVQQKRAEVLGQVHVATRVHPAESLWALAYGGPMALLPLLVSDVQMDTLEPKLGDVSIDLATHSLSAPIFRIISMVIRHPGNNEELCRTSAPELLSKILNYTLQARSNPDVGKHILLCDEDIVAAVTSICQSLKHNHPLKVKLFGTLLLDLKVWGTCSYVLQKKLLSSLADMVFIESSALRDANAVQVLLDGCRRCFWVIRKNDCIDTFSLHSDLRPFGEVNALADELLVVIELLMGVAPTSTANEDMQCLLSFLVDCSQPNQVARLLHLIYRLIVQPNTSRAQIFAHSFISCGGVETLLVLLQREAASGNCNGMDYSCSNDSSNVGFETGTGKAKSEAKEPEFLESKEIISAEPDAYFQSIINCTSTPDTSFYTNGERWSSTSRPRIVKSFGDIRFSTNEESSRSNAFNIDNGDGIVVAIVNLFGALISSRHLKFDSNISLSCEANSIPTNGLFDEGNTMFDDKVSLLLFALQRTLQAAPQRLMTTNVHMAFLAASANISSDNGLNIYDCGHHLEHAQLLVVLLRALPHASREFQLQTVQGLFFLACSHPENRSTLTCMAEWPEWILEVFISNYAMASTEESDNVSVREIEDLIYNFLIITLEHSMRKKDGWKDVEATIHCAEWLSMAGGCSTGELRRRREEALPIFRRRLLGGLLDFAAWELAAQTQIIAAAAAVAAKASPHEAKAEAEHATHLTVALAENAIVILMLVEDHLRLQGQRSYPADCAQSSTSISSAKLIKSGSLDSSRNETINTAGVRRTSLSTQAGMVSFDALASEADENGQVSAAVLERLTAAAAAEPFESVRCAFVSYGSCVLDLAESWKQRSRMWYGVDLPTNTTFGGGARDWESWQSAIERDSSGKWIELPLVKKSVLMLQALLLDESGLGSGLSIGGGSVASISGMAALCHLLDSDQPFLCMLRMILLSMREEDTEGDVFVRPTNINDSLSVGISQAAHVKSLDHSDMLSIRRPRSALLWSALGPLLIMPVSESKRQRVLVACCVLYSEVWNAIGRDRKPIRKQYVEAIVPPFVSVLKRWRPILAGIHELASPEVGNPLNADDFVLSADALPIEAALAMISPSWSAAFASPPAALALAMIAAGASGGNTAPPSKNTHYRCETSLFERKPTRLHTFSSFQKPPEKSIKFPTMPKDKAAAKAAALAAARDLERNAKIGSGRGLSAVAMATSAQRRSSSDLERSRRWNILETMGAAWTECAQTLGSRSVSGREFSALCYKYIAVLVTSFALARNMQRVEMERLVQVDLLERHRLCTGIHAWRKLICRLLEMNQLFGYFGDHLGNAKLAYWMLDTTENSYRMRRFLKRCYKTPYYQRAVLLRDVHMEESYDRRVSVTDDPFVKTTVVIPDGIPTEDENEYAEKPVSIIVDNNVDNHNMFSNDDPTLHGAIVSSNSWDSDDQILIRPTSGFIHGFVSGETDDRIIVELPSLMVRPMMVVSGIFQITTSRINFIADEHTTDEFIAESLAASVQTKEQGKNKSWSITSLSQVFCRRYLVRRTALEFFMADRSNYFFDFGSIEGCRNASRGIIQARPPHLHNLYLTANRPEKFLIKAQLMERWASWEISNFEYLMELNTLSGRSYNDITQYPIFPWIIADYHSKTLNLENPSVYRDLSKPVGALNPDRLKKFRERYSTFDDPIMPKYHYGSHYSNIKTVLYFLIRIEPYATLSAKLLGESNRANQIFSNICHSWNNVFEDMQDVKELVPEMFYLPEILTNENNIDIRSNKIGESKDPVKLPPWADNPVDFIHKHRRALESEHVSSHLHEWIDLIFGYKQRGEEAASADNAFFYTSYEGAVDLDRILDPVHRCDVRKKIAYFGQTPSLLFTVPHIQRKPLAEILKLQVIFRNPSELQGRPIPQPERCKLPAASIRASPDSIVIVDLLAPAAHVEQHKWCPYAPDGPLLLQHRRTAGTLSRIFKTPAESLSDDRRQCSRVLAFPAPGIRSPAAIVAITCDYQVITGGHADNSIKLISTDEAKTMETASGHCAPVTCLSLSPDSIYLATGSRDTTVLLWRIHRRTSPSERCIEGPISVSRGHRDEVVCCSVNSSVGVIASSSASAGVLLHSLHRGRFLRKLDASPANSVRVSSHGAILTWNAAEKSLRTFTVNGIPIAIATLSPSIRRITCMEISADGGSAIIAASSCESEDENAVLVPSLCFLDLHSLEVVHSVALGEGQDITSIAPSEDGFSLLVSTADKQLIMFSNPAVSIC